MLLLRWALCAFCWAQFWGSHASGHGLQASFEAHKVAFVTCTASRANEAMGLNTRKAATNKLVHRSVHIASSLVRSFFNGRFSSQMGFLGPL